jgi:lysophospholipase L1-like esterase
MRSAREFGYGRVPGQPRILFVGDSYTFGQGVSNNETFQHILGRDYLQGWEVMNFGVPGYGAGQMLLLFERVGAAYRPDVVVLGFFDRGFNRTLLRFRGYSKPYFMLSDGKLELFGTPVIAPEELYRLYETGERRFGSWNHSYVAAEIGRAIIRNFSNLHVSREGPVWQLIAAILARFDRSVREAGAQPFLLIIPDRPGSTRRERLYQQLNDLAQEEATALGMPVLSVRDALSREDVSTIHRPREIGGHLSARGHELVAQQLAAALARLPLRNTNNARPSATQSQR